MNAFFSRLKGWLKAAKDDLVWGFKHPKTVRKAIVATATQAATLITAFTTLFPHVSSAHAAAFTAITSLLTGLITFLTSNGVVEHTGGE